MEFKYQKDSVCQRRFWLFYLKKCWIKTQGQRHKNMFLTFDYEKVTNQSKKVISVAKKVILTFQYKKMALHGRDLDL